MTVTTTEFLASVKRAVTLPSSQIRFSNADLFKFADEETESTILPMLTSIRQEFLVKKRAVPVVVNQSEYKVPYRAVGRTLRDLKLLDANGIYLRNLSYISPEFSNNYTFGQTGEPTAFTVRGEYIVLLPTPASSSYFVEMYYELAPAMLVDTSEAGTIVTADTTTGIVTLSAAITGFGTGDSMDIIDGQTGNTVLAEGITNSNVAGTAITFTASDIPSSVAAGDYLALANQTPVVQLPQELVQSLVQAVVCRIVEALGDYEGLKAATEKLKMKMDAAERVLTPRVESQVPVVVSNNGLLRRGPLNFRWRYTP